MNYSILQKSFYIFYQLRNDNIELTDSRKELKNIRVPRMKSFKMSLSPTLKTEVGGSLISKYMYGIGDTHNSAYKQAAMSVKRQSNKKSFKYKAVNTLVGFR